MAAADDRTLAANSGSDAVRDHILRFAVHLPVVKSPLPGSAYNGVGNGMGEMLLQAGRDAQHLTLVLPVECDNL